MRIYVNGTEETSFATDDTANVAQNEDSEMNLSSRVIRLGYGNEDDYAFGGGGGMVLQIEPIYRCIKNLEKKKKYDEIIFMTPDGNKLNQNLSNQLSLKKNLIILCGHYKGIDERIREHMVTKEISIGDYVLTGGELPTAVLIDSILRLIPGVINNESTALSDSFQDNLLGHPNYSRPANFKGWKVPKILLSGNQKKIDEWRINKSYKKTKSKRPDLLK